ncbi:MAG: large subunit ribosomal protein, partial [Campylobacterota bacterium]|nr:large subunit ribosomal protein [Campylobacterota bacterium]
ATKTLVNEIAPKYVDRPGGYTRITRTRIRRGDATTMAFIELV